MQVLQASRAAAVPVVTLISNLPAVEIVPVPLRPLAIEVLRPVLQAVRFGRLIDVEYQSMSNANPGIQRVLPHTLVFDGWRWHMRAYSYTRAEYRDLVLARIGSVIQIAEPAAPCPVDALWEQLLTVEIGPHPELSATQKIAIERDFGMLNGQLTIPVRAALLPYLLLALRIGNDDRQRKAMTQQIVLLNREQLRPFIRF